MSSLYNLEPQPTAKVLLQTSSGDILIELFAKQTPLSSRNFLQLCLDGYYNNTIFHRLVPGFILQGGDPSGTGEGGEAIYDGGLFADEFHSRLKFNRRGLLGMANGGAKNDNASQFFLTLGATPELDGKNTMFGRVIGDTIYNLAKMGEAELVEGGNNRPVYPTRILATEVLVNPFDDMVRREKKAKPLVREKNIPKKSKKPAGKALLSFGADEDDGDAAPIIQKEKFNTKLVVAPQGMHDANPPKAANPSPAKKVHNQTIHPLSPPPSSLHGNQAPASPPMKETAPVRVASLSPELPDAKKPSLLDTTNLQIAELKASMKRNIAVAPEDSKKRKSALEQMIPATSSRARKRKFGASNSQGNNDSKALEILNSFRRKLENSAGGNHNLANPPLVSDEEGKNEDIIEHEVNEALLCDLHFIADCESCKSWNSLNLTGVGLEEEDGDTGWMSHVLTFEKDRKGKDLAWKKKNEQDLVVIDPREKEKGLLQDKRSKQGDRGRTAKTKGSMS
ncbi:MAG: Peptidyl-prolyl isomerase cwc27 [Trizodia sp. TS-e1964]|nr:MAG: Peptidyl-prolyl isomerase cwc27 [Trizodia sp. TS-e1964]